MVIYTAVTFIVLGAYLLGFVVLGAFLDYMVAFCFVDGPAFRDNFLMEGFLEFFMGCYLKFQGCGFLIGLCIFSGYFGVSHVMALFSAQQSRLCYGAFLGIILQNLVYGPFIILMDRHQRFTWHGLLGPEIDIQTV